MKPSRFIDYREFLLQKNCSNHMAIILETYGFLIKYNWMRGYTCGYQLYIFQHKAMKRSPLCSPAYETLTNISLIQVERTATIQTLPTLVNSLFIELMHRQKNIADVLGDLWSSSVNVSKRRMITAFLSSFCSWEGMQLQSFYFWNYVSSLDSQQIALFEVSDVPDVGNIGASETFLPRFTMLEHIRKGFSVASKVLSWLEGT